MVNDSLTELYGWAKDQLSMPIMLGYRLDKVNGQVADKVCLLLRQPNAERPGAEIEIDYMAGQTLPYLASFSLLPLAVGQPRPHQLRQVFAT